ncbi:MAG: hypothetical protein AAGI46_10380 [Planctomycetota bacterium]
MDGVTTAIVLFVFVCVLFPRLIANRPQYYIGLALTLVIIVLTPIATMGFGERGLFVAIGALQAAAVLLLFLSAGGLSVRGLSSEMLGAFEVIRRGETEKEVIIPIGGKKESRRTARDSIGEPGQPIDLTTDGADSYPARKKGPAPTPPTPPSAKKPDEDEDGPIPLD